MTDTAVALGWSARAWPRSAVAAVLVPPTRRLAPRVRPYTIVGRVPASGAAPTPPIWSPTSDGRVVVDASCRLFGPPVARVRATARPRSSNAAPTRRWRARLRQAGFVDVGPDEYRTRMAVHVLAFGAGGAGLGVARVPSPARGRRARRVRRRVRRVAATRPARAGHRRSARAHPARALHGEPAPRHARAHRRRPGPGDAAHRRPRRRAWSSTSSARCSRRCATASPSPRRSGAPPTLTPEPAAARTYKLFAAGAERGVDLADGLRALSEDLRDSRREEIRQTATKRRAAMLVPTIAVLAPVMLLFIAAPLPSIVFGSR